ncbi:MAG TPA: DinB family protein [Bacteroidia bacterium]|nr:DinB family protein [Bacteroidia bacterium]
MNNTLLLETLFDYNQQSNEKILELLTGHEAVLTEKSIRLANHIINAHHIWNNRIEQNEMPYQVWEIHKFSDLRRLSASNYTRSIDLLKDYLPETEIMYNTTKGEVFKNNVLDILFHIINHSTYHRAQIATELKSTGLSVPVTDYIVFKRTNLP